MRASRLHLRKAPYYLRSLGSLARLATTPSLARCLVAGGGTLALRDGLSLDLSSRLELLVLKECVVDDVYRLRRLPPGREGVVVDVGAGVGEFALAAARRLPCATVHAFEPNPESYRLLRRNIQRAAAGNVHAWPFAVGTEAVYRLLDAASGPRGSVVPANARGAGVVVQAKRLDEALPHAGIALLKIDCEGLELDVLASASGLLGRTQRVELEYHRQLAPDSDLRAIELLRSYGFDTELRPDPYDSRMGYVSATRSTTGSARGTAPPGTPST